MTKVSRKKRNHQVEMKAASKGQRRQASAGGINASSASSPANKTRCAFFFSKKGCRFGEKCKYSHMSDDNSNAAQASGEKVNIDAPLSSSELISVSENESHDEIMNDETHAKHSKKKALQITMGSGNGTWSPQDRNDKNSHQEPSTSMSSSINNNICAQDIEGGGANTIVLKELQSQLQAAMKQSADLMIHATLLQGTLLHIAEQINTLSMNNRDNNISGEDERVAVEGGHFADTEVIDNEDRNPVGEPVDLGRNGNRGGRVGNDSANVVGRVGNDSANVIVPTKNDGSGEEKQADEVIHPVNTGADRSMVLSVGGAGMKGELVGSVMTQRRQEDEVANHCSKRLESDIVNQDGCEWVCSVCTLINQKPSLTCLACGTIADWVGEDELPTLGAPSCNNNGNAAAPAETNSNMKQELQHVEEAKKRQEEKARKKREKSERKKVELARKKEEERVAAEAEKKRQLQIKREKETSMENHEAVVKQSSSRAVVANEEFTRAINKEFTRAIKEKSRDATITKLELGEQKKTPSRRFRDDRNMGALAAKNDVPLVVDQLSYYIKNKRTFAGRELSSDGLPTGRAVSPIFGMLQNESTAENGRKLLVLETDVYKCKEEYNKLVSQKNSLEGGIQVEELNIKKSEEEIAELERNRRLFNQREKDIEEDIQKKWAARRNDLEEKDRKKKILMTDELVQREKEKFEAEEERRKEINTRKDEKDKERIDHLRDVIESSKTSIKSQKSRLAAIPILTKMNQLQKLRQDISNIKGDATDQNVKSSKKEGNFHIDGSRDDRGFTVLMIAAQNNDFLTAQTCFDVGADAHVKSPEGLTAIDYSFYFQHNRITNLILRNGGSPPQKQTEAWDSLQSMAPQSADSSRTWDYALQVAQSAALPAETLMESPEKCEANADTRMNILTAQERSNMDCTCFEARLIDQNINSDHIKRVVLLEQKVYNWCVCADPTTRSNFIEVLEGLKPPSVRRPGVKATDVHRRAIVGTTSTFEVLASRFDDMSNEKGVEKGQVVIYSPFVSGEVEGVTSIGVLVWAVAPDAEASLYKTLVANTEFMRHKVALKDRFLQHREGVLKLGKDMHLLDLQSTSIWTTATMDLYVLNVDHGDLDCIGDHGFSAKKRIVHSEEQVNKAIFRTSRAEANENDNILASERLDMSSLVSGGAGTGKTLLMIRKVAREEPSRHVLVVTRLPRLVDVIKTAVEEERSGSVETLSFTTYDDLLQLLARRVVPDDASLCESFVQFNRVRFDCDDSNISFLQQFLGDFLNSAERREMKSFEIEPLTLWHAFIVIKSNSKCARTKQPLSLDDYLALPISFGLTKTQRKLCYGLFLKYEDWRHNGHYWDEMDRVLYVLTHGPSVFRDDKFISWATRVNRFGEMDLLDDEGTPLYPFFHDVVCADEAQDFTEIDLLLFTKMSASIRSLFLSADVAQSVEVGVNMRATTVNDVLYSLVKDGKQQVKDVLQYIDLQTNHRTHAQNLAIGQAVRSILARSFQIPMTHELALINGELPRTMLIKKIRDLADASVFQGGNIVFVAPDEKVHELRLQFQALEIHNDVFGVREAKGLEFDACALLGFFGHFEELGSKEEWQNILRWLSSSSNITKTAGTGEKVDGLMLRDCDYRLSAPKVSDEAMMLYTGLTRARNHLYLIELEDTSKEKKLGKGLAQFAFRRLKDLGLAKPVSHINEGNGDNLEMTPAENKARGILYITQALSMSRNMEPFSNVKNKFMEAMSRFAPEKGNDRELADKCEKHLDALTKMHSLMGFVKERFLIGGVYDLAGKFAEVLEFEQMAGEFFSLFLCDSFLMWEIHSVRLLIEEVFFRTPYEKHFKSICATVKELEQAV